LDHESLFWLNTKFLDQRCIDHILIPVSASS
jgi:hypothetical protein